MAKSSYDGSEGRICLSDSKEYTHFCTRGSTRLSSLSSLLFHAIGQCPNTASKLQRIMLSILFLPRLFYISLLTLTS
jgi:hypothetical protein